MKGYHFNPGDKIICINKVNGQAIFVGDEYEVLYYDDRMEEVWIINGYGNVNKYGPDLFKLRIAASSF